jgi:hydrogenase expression/formation protein HypE
MVTSTAGIGSRHPLLDDCIDIAGRKERPSNLHWLRDDASIPGDHIILSGSVGDHGVSLLSFREGYGFDTDIISDIAPMNGIMDRSIRAGGIASAKDLTRGGLSNGLNEWAKKTGNEILVSEDSIPVKAEVISACDMLGMDPFEIGNEGKIIIAVADGHQEDVLKTIRSTDYGKDASIIGRVRKGKPRVILETSVGGKRIMDPPYGDPVPRIC